MTTQETAPQTRITGCASVKEAVSQLSSEQQEKIDTAMKSGRIEEVPASQQTPRPRGPR
jgi:hypothetical protein